jgi:hypothetical protein
VQTDSGTLIADPTDTVYQWTQSFHELAQATHTDVTEVLMPQLLGCETRSGSRGHRCSLYHRPSNLRDESCLHRTTCELTLTCMLACLVQHVELTSAWCDQYHLAITGVANRSLSLSERYVVTGSRSRGDLSCDVSSEKGRKMDVHDTL